MDTVRQHVEVNAPIEACFETWANFENFPEFMANVKDVQKVNENESVWVTRILGQRHEWRARTTESTRPNRIAWEAVGDVGMDGIVTFAQIGDGKTRVDVELTWRGGGLTTMVANVLKLDDVAVKQDLHNFKSFVEGRRTATMAR